MSPLEKLFELLYDLNFNIKNFVIENQKYNLEMIVVKSQIKITVQKMLKDVNTEIDKIENLKKAGTYV